MQEKKYFVYDDAEAAYLKAKDPALGRAMDEIGHVYRVVNPDIFMALINAIIGQQISTKAQETVWARFLDSFSPVTPASIAACSPEQLQGCGISMRKALYIHEIATSVLEGSLDLDSLQAMPDEQVCQRLSQIKGIGVWTAEMLMIFSMQRKDVLSWGDMAILRGMRMLYRHKTITPQLFAKYKRRYAPYGSIASLYLWQISHGVCQGLYDPAAKIARKEKRAAPTK